MPGVPEGTEVRATIPLAGPVDLPLVLQMEEAVAPVEIPEEKIRRLGRQRPPDPVAAVEPRLGSTGPTRSWRWLEEEEVAAAPGPIQPDFLAAAAKVDRLTPTGKMEPAAEAPTTAGAGVEVGVDIQQGVGAEVCDPAGIPIRAETEGLRD